PLFVLPETLPRAEQALATPDMLVLAGVNAKQAVFLERWFMDTPAASPAGPMPAVGERGLIDHLGASHVDARRDLDYVLYALYPGEGPGVRQAVALIGRFDPAAIRAYLVDALHAKPAIADGRTSYEVTLSDANSCRVSATWRVTPEHDWILISDPASHGALVSRLAGSAQGDGADTRWWHELALTDVAGIAIRRPQPGVSLPFIGSAADTMAPEIAAFDRAYLGLGINPMPPEGQLRLVLDAKDAPRAAEQIKGWAQSVRESRDRWAATMPGVARLYDGLDIRTEGARSTVEVTVDRGTVARLQDLGNELVSQIFGGFGIQGGAPTAGAEQIETNPGKFEPVAGLASLGAYDPAAQFAEKVDVKAGPFGLRLDAIRMGATPDDGLELVVAGFANGIPNLAARPDRATLMIDSVTSAIGQELLKPEDCGRERNAKPADFTSMMPPRLTATKTLHLIAGADAHSLRRVAGRVALRLPTKTESVTVAEPSAGTAIEKYGARVTLSHVTGGSLSYQVTGERDRVLLIRALNAKGQPLASPMKVSGDLLLGSGTAGRMDFSGTIKTIEIVFAAEEQKAEFPFALTDFSLAGEARPLAGDDTPDFPPYSDQAFRAQFTQPLPASEKAQPRLAVAQVTPFEISLDKAQPFFQLSLGMTVRAPDAPSFRRRFNLGELQLTRVALKDGTILTPPASAGSAKTDRSIWSAPLRFMSAAKQGALAETSSFSIDSKAKPDDLKSVEGTLSLRYPVILDTLRLGDLSVGQSAQSGTTNLAVTARTRQGITLETSESADRVVYVRLLNAEGQALMFSSPQVTALPGGGARIELSPFNAPARAEIVIAREMESAAFPFNLTLP
ncbi:MAG TPA: hypothetical protein VJN67_22625, partial [Stellaceae bacterium]|nr:hypothetical protein [Stellaceae bacterium]